MKRLRYLRAAERHLAGCDPRFASLLDAHGRCTLRQATDLFEALVSIIVSQQISTKAANSISARIRERFAATGVTSGALLRARASTLRSCGLSGNKQRAIRSAARAVEYGGIELKRLARLTDDEVKEALLPINGIGPWSVDMVLMFVLGRPDVLPIGDFGLRAAVKKHYDLPNLPKPEEIPPLAEPWRPYRTIASWYLWRSIDPVPQG